MTWIRQHRRQPFNKEDDLVNKTVEKVSFIKRQSRTGVGEKIRMFEILTTGNECVYHKGMCEKHGVALTRHIKTRRMSVVSECGDIFRKERDFAALQCPIKTSQHISSVPNPVTDLLPVEEGKLTNKKLRLISHGEEDQSASNKKNRG